VWIDLLLQKKSLPSVLAPDLPFWLTVSWVFKKATPFKEVTSLLTMLGDENMGGEALQVLPVPDRIIGENISKPADTLPLTFVRKSQKPSSVSAGARFQEHNYIDREVSEVEDDLPTSRRFKRSS
jgi:hypothetical protein